MSLCLFVDVILLQYLKSACFYIKKGDNFGAATPATPFLPLVRPTGFSRLVRSHWKLNIGLRKLKKNPRDSKNTADSWVRRKKWPKISQRIHVSYIYQEKMAENIPKDPCFVYLPGKNGRKYPKGSRFGIFTWKKWLIFILNIPVPWIQSPCRQMSRPGCPITYTQQSIYSPEN